MAEERRYNDDEFAAILRSAAEAQARGRKKLAARRQGFSLAELMDIAEQVGLDTELVAEAARRLPSQRESLGARLFGGPSRIRLEFTVGGAIGPSDHARILEELRRTDNTQGKAEATGGALEWKTEGDPDQVSVNLTPGPEDTRVMILANRDAMGAITFGASVLGGLGGVALVEALGIGGVTELVLMLGAGVGGTFGVARILWQRGTSGLRRRLARLSDAVAAAVEAGGDREPARESDGRSQHGE